MFIFFYFHLVISECQIITTIAGTGTAGYSGDGGPATSAQLNSCSGVALDTAGNIYIAEQGNHCIRKINQVGIITTLAGTGIAGFSGDGGNATSAQLNTPTGLAVDDSGNVYIGDQLNNRIRKIDKAGIISTIVGSGVAGYSGDGMLAISAKLKQPSYLCFDNYGNLLISDVANNVIRKIDASGIISTIAGTGTAGFSGDNGQAALAQLYEPASIICDKHGNLFISEEVNSRVRKVNSSGIINTYAGTGAMGYNGDNVSATSANLYAPTGVVVDSIGNLFISDMENNRVRKVGLSGTITTAIGNGVLGYSGDGGPCNIAEINSPVQISFDKYGNLFIADGGNNVIRKVTNIGVMGIDEIKKQRAIISIYPNPNSGNFSIALSQSSNNVQIEICNSLGEVVQRKYVQRNDKTVSVSGLHEGMYLVKVIKEDKLLSTQKVIVVK